MYVGERFTDAGINLIFGQSHIAGAECHILIDRFGKQLVFGVLEYHADVAASAVRVFAVCQIFAVPEHASFSGVSKAVQVLYKEIIAKWGRLDVLVNNAGTDNSTWLTKLKQSEWDAVCNLNMKGPYTMMKYAIPHLIKTKGCIVNTASVAGVYGCPTGLPYPASKAALIAMTKSVAYSFADRGVRVNAVAPGVVNTDMVANMPQFAKDSVGDTIPMKRFAEPEDIANGILFLSSSAASYVTGVCLQIDGGYRPNNLPK